MAAKKKGATAPRPRSGWVSEDDRKTERITLRLDPERMAFLRSYAAKYGWTLAGAVGNAIDCLRGEKDGIG